LEQLTAQLQQQLAEYTQSQAHLQSQLEDSEHKIVGLETFKRTLESRVSNKEAESSELGQELKRLRDQVSHERQEATTYANRLKQELGDQIAQLEEARAALQKDLKANQEALKGSGEENEALKSTINRQSVTILDLESQIAALKAKLQAAQAEIIYRSVTCDDLTKRLTDAQESISGLKGQLQEAERVRRRLHNMVQELKGNIRVFCRVRPLLAAERKGNGDEELKHLQIVKKLDDPEEINLQQEVESATGQMAVKSFPFQFDRVFGPHASQQDVFEEISQLVQSALDGYRVCIFAYGQTGSGKTFTMEGSSEEERLLGMIPRAVQQVFETAADLNRDKHWQFSFEASYLEIYNESIRDLLGSGDDTAKHDIKHLPNSSKTIVTDLSVVPVESPEAVLSLLKQAGHNRAVAETLCNDRSSRSHR
jgi:kinesin family protein C1